MHIGRHIVQQLVLQFGPPAVERWSFPLGEEEFAEVKKNRSLGRAHDVTVLIERGDELVVVRKPDYPPEAYRAPTGGIHPEESFLDGAVREAREKTGLEVEIRGYPLYVLVSFTYQEETAQWSTHVLTAVPLSNGLSPSEESEIASARWIEWNQLVKEVNPVLRDSGLGGLAYRARVHEKAYELRMEGGKSK
jgi:ADP-ribose pyrophosphatase YjhB (NUDIX family)